MQNNTVQYQCAPPTPYIAYLRQGCGDEVRDHVVYRLGVSDELRCRAVPYRKDAGWRDSMGDSHIASMLQPLMLEMSEEQWNSSNKGGGTVASRWSRKVPDFMRQTPHSQSTLPNSELPPLRHGWKLEPRRFPLVPYWVLTMEQGKDHDCYGRLSYDKPHDTVYSQHKPNWNRSLVPWHPRVLSVREKARVQGFPDSFVFDGDVDSKHKQIANAVEAADGDADEPSRRRSARASAR